MNKYISFDIGGTFIKYGIIGADQSILEHYKIKTPKTLYGLLEIIYKFTELHMDAQGIAISLPGAVSNKGIIYGSSAISYIHGPNIKERIASAVSLPIYIENDANCAGYAEVWAGAANGKKDVLVMTIGTGIGGAIIKNGELHKGANLHGGEFGFMLLNSNDNEMKADEWVRMDSTLSMVRKVAKRKNIDSDSLSGEEIFTLAASGDQICLDAVDEFSRLLAIGLFNLQYIYDPEIILIGGGISAREDLVGRIYEQLDKILDSFPQATIRPVIETCQFRQNANLLGAVYGLTRELASEV
ncbi:ROK family protein [Oceanobacillus oncorhynchi]|uniref:ROK family protein n=1 Tax=Oceanobacillus oncorhynchi TaxID=545501 RepID=UPI0034D532AD